MEHFLSQVEVGYQFSVISFNSQPVAALRQAQGPIVEALQPLVGEPAEPWLVHLGKLGNHLSN